MTRQSIIREKWFKYQVNLNSVFLSRTYKFKCCMSSGSSSKARCLPTERRNAGWHMYQGVVHTSLRLRSRIYNNSLGERLLFRAWNFPRSKQASSQQRRLWMWKRGHLVPWRRVKVCTSSRPTLCPCKNLRGAKLVSVHPLQRKSRFHSGRD